jgi:AcrR family transcriptional regulator
MISDMANTKAPTPTEPSATRRGRPRNAAADQAILGAAIDLLFEVGIDGTTMSSVIARSGVARATVYRRWPTRDALIAAALREVRGRAPYPISGDLETDLARGAEQARAIFAEPRFQAFLPLLVRDLLREQVSDGISDTFDRVAPNHRRLAEEYAARAASAGLRSDIDPYVPSNIIVGAYLARLLSTGRPASHEMSEQLVDVLLNGLRKR